MCTNAPFKANNVEHGRMEPSVGRKPQTTSATYEWIPASRLNFTTYLLDPVN